MTSGDSARNTGRTASAAGRLARLGFTDALRAEATLADGRLARLAASDDRLVETLAAAADPDLALAGLASLVGAAPGNVQADLLAALSEPHGLVMTRLVAVLGASAALGEHLVRHPDQWVVMTEPTEASLAEVRARLLSCAQANRRDGDWVAELTGPAGYDALRSTYRRRLLAIAAADLTGEIDVARTAHDLADLAAATLEAALAIARGELPEDAPRCRLAVIAMGKAGGLELNYSSDVDVMFVAEAMAGEDETAALATATRLAASLMRICSTSTAEGEIWPVDAGLRPEGRQGALVRTLASYTAYYERWASTWEFQALLKARPAAGDPTLGAAFVDAVTPMIWSAVDRPDFVVDVQAMRRRVEENVPAKEAERQLKLGRGGLRDVEFAVQLLQLVHGRSDIFVRSPTTLLALEQLSTRGYVGRDDAAELDRAYRFLRTLEHRIQLVRLRRTHTVPEDPVELRRLARSMGHHEQPVDQLNAEWRKHRHEVRRLHEKLFYRPLLDAVARLDASEARLTPEAALVRLEALGYADPQAALRHLDALTSGVSRRAAIQRTLLPVMLAWFAEQPDPDAGLLGFRRVSDALGTTPWYLRLLRDDSLVAERMARVLAVSRYATDLLLRAPEAVRLLGDDSELRPRAASAVAAEMLAAVGRYEDPGEAAIAVRAIRRRELFRVSAADLVGLLDVDSVGAALSDIAAATLQGGLAAATRAVEAQRGSPMPTRLAVIGMGRLGGHEIGYGSDADVLFVHDPLTGAGEREAQDSAHAVVGELRRLLSLPAPDPPLLVDADLRPEGRQGPLVRTLASYAAYYARWSLVWEAQALLRAAPLAGDVELGAEFLALIDPIRWPAGGLVEADVREIRRIKARVEAERMPRGADVTLHTKLGRGGLSDVEWTVQLLQLRHAAAVPGLRVTRTLAALDAAVDADLVSRADAEVLADAWRAATRVRNAAMLVRGRASDSLPVDVRERAGVARVVGYAPGRTGDLEEDYRRRARRARGVVERVFYA